MKKKFRKGLLAVLLVVSMLAAMGPMAAFAVGEEEDAPVIESQVPETESTESEPASTEPAELTPAVPAEPVYNHIDVRIPGASVIVNVVVKNQDGKVLSRTPMAVTAYVTKVESVTINGTKYPGSDFRRVAAYEFKDTKNVSIPVSSINARSRAVLVVDLIDAAGKTYNDVKITYGYAGITAAALNCVSDGLCGGPGLDFYCVTADDCEIEYVLYQTEVAVEKVWDDADDHDGIRPDCVTVSLYANGVLTGRALTLNEKNNWSGTFTCLLDRIGCYDLEYTVKECPVEGYETVITGNETDGFVVTNIHEPTPVVPDPEPTEPVDPDPEPTEPVDPDPEPTEPVDPDPEPTEPVDPDPEPTEPVDPDPEPTEPVDPDPEPTEPVDPDPEPTEPVNPDPEPSETPEEPEESDEPTPVVPGDDTPSKPSTPKPTNPAVPQTDDSTHIGMWLGVMLVSAAGLGVVALTMGRKSRGARQK